MIPKKSYGQVALDNVRQMAKDGENIETDDVDTVLLYSLFMATMEVAHQMRRIADRLDWAAEERVKA